MNKIDFKGKCKGVRLTERSTNADDNHIMFTILTEDDENWYKDTNYGSSSYWIDELIEQLQKAKEFIETQEPLIYKNKIWGYNFKK